MNRVINFLVINGPIINLVFIVYLVLSAIWGVILGFNASVVVGAAYIVLSPLALLTGVVSPFGYNIAEKLAQALGLN